MSFQRSGIATICFALLSLSFCTGPLPAAGLSSSVSLESLEVDETDFFDLGFLLTGQVALGITTPLAGLENDFDTPDTVMATFSSGDVGPGDISASTLTINDDSVAETNLPSVDSIGSIFRLQTPQSDEYTVGVTGFENLFDGFPHTETGPYLLTHGLVDADTVGGDFADTDGVNETIAGADPLPLGALDSKIAVNTLDPTIADGDTDFYEIQLSAGDVLSAMTASVDDLGNGDFDFPDTVLFLFDDQGDHILHDDEAGDVESDYTIGTGAHDGQGSAFHFLAPSAGAYYLAVTGYPSGENDDIVPHPEYGNYALLVSRYSTVPEPAYGDFDGDGDVDGADFLKWQREDGTSEGLAEWQQTYGQGSQSSQNSTHFVPEPSAYPLFAVSILLSAVGLDRQRSRF